MVEAISNGIYTSTKAEVRQTTSHLQIDVDNQTDLDPDFKLCVIHRTSIPALVSTFGKHSVYEGVSDTTSKGLSILD